MRLPEADSGLRFGILGRLAINDSSGESLVPRAPMTRMLLAALLVTPGRTVGVDHIETVLWGEDPPASSRAAVMNQVQRLRNALGAHRARLHTVASGYLLEIREGELDADVFSDRLRAAHTASQAQDWAAVGHEAAEALACWRGDLFADLPAVAERERALVQHFVEGRTQALELYFDAQLHLGRHREALPELSRLAVEHPLRESFHSALMIALYRSSRQADALNAFDRMREALADELGIDPTPALQELRQRVLTMDPALLSPEGCGGLLAAAAQPAPAPKAVPTIPSQLPGDVADFRGRFRETAGLRRLLLAEPTIAPQLATVTGVGGSGKTALALHVAHQVSERYPDGRLYVDLRGVDANPLDPAEALAGFLRGLGMADSDIPGDDDARIAAYRSALSGRRVLVVLDNARDAAQVRPLLPGSAGCTALVTSRRTLVGLAGAVHLGLGALADVEALALFAGIAGPDRVAAEPEATEEVLASCAGLPLALRIAAARLAARPSWSVASLAGRLARHRGRLDELQADDLAVRASFRLSYDGLLAAAAQGQPDPARAFRLLGLAPGPETGLAAAAALFGWPEARAERALEHLVDSGLLDSPAPERYRLHDLLRLFAAELAATDETEESRYTAVGRVAEWYVRTLIEADAALFPKSSRPDPLPESQDWVPSGLASFEQALAWCEAERPNLVSGAELAAEYGFHELAWRVSGFAWAYFNLKRHLADWIATTETGMHSARACDDPAAESTVLTSRGAAFMCLEQWEAARECLTAGLAIRERSGDRPGQMACLVTLATALHREQRYEEAREHYLRALTFVGAPELRRREVVLLGNLGELELEVGDPLTALGYLERVRELNLEFGDRGVEAERLTAQGMALLRLGRFREAQAMLREGIEVARSAEYRFCEAQCLGLLAQAAVELGDWQEADSCRAVARALLPLFTGREARIAMECLDEGRVERGGHEVHDAHDVQRTAPQRSAPQSTAPQWTPQPRRGAGIPAMRRSEKRRGDLLGRDICR
ncbi:transcriptional regulator AfsR [Catenulispora yoronensis]|uniref:Transcriptional regulator AfsR n=1 Tax=Catenulispora yoronensis TaxID=450799 RepID=A0ABP5G2E1_9ACTN